jgi:hypothetical protein
MALVAGAVPLQEGSHGMHFNALVRSALLTSVLLWAGSGQAGEDPLASWNDTATKRAIVDFVGAVSDRRGKAYVPPDERIAVFDNDGTLWTEKPLYTHVFALLDRAKAQMAADPTLKERQPYKAIAAKDKGYFAELYENQALDFLADELIAVPFGGTTTSEYSDWNRAWLKNWKHPRFGVGVRGLIYQPMLELIRYLEANQFKVYIVTGKFAAAWTSCRWFGFGSEARLVWALTLPQMAATLASAVVGYNTMNASGERLLERDFVNVVLALVVATCVAGPILVQRTGRRALAARTEHPEST